MNTLGKTKAKKKNKRKKKKKTLNYSLKELQSFSNRTVTKLYLTHNRELLCEGTAKFLQQNMAPDCT
jgi:hypothetical protein